MASIREPEQGTKPLQNKATGTRVPGPVNPTVKTFHRTEAKQESIR
jgi:hypothetical protein